MPSADWDVRCRLCLKWTNGAPFNLNLEISLWPARWQGKRFKGGKIMIHIVAFMQMASGKGHLPSHLISAKPQPAPLPTRFMVKEIK